MSEEKTIDAEEALKKVLEFVRYRQHEIRLKQDQFHEIGATESKQAQISLHDELSSVAEMINQFRCKIIANTKSIAEGSKERIEKCDRCGDMVDVNHNSSQHGTCNQVWGRRGWRALGEYDG